MGNTTARYIVTTTRTQLSSDTTAETSEPDQSCCYGCAAAVPVTAAADLDLTSIKRLD